jgi:hypothetical protein
MPLGRELSGHGLGGKRDSLSLTGPAGNRPADGDGKGRSRRCATPFPANSWRPERPKTGSITIRSSTDAYVTTPLRRALPRRRDSSAGIPTAKTSACARASLSVGAAETD